MRIKSKSARTAPADTLRGELEQLGVSPGEAAPLAECLIRLSRDLPEREYRALLEGVILGQRAAREPARSPELQHMLEDFAVELQKLDEGLRVLAAYVKRLREFGRARPALSPARPLH
ncbi:MAG TPA: hypothetical protein VKH41_14500 [Myxococcota bacterium]|nr:hypothetical protein [Myxococcota bacterium]